MAETGNINTAKPDLQVVIPYITGGNLGACYNEYMRQATDWVLFLDHDALILRPEWHALCIDAIKQLGHKAGWISAVTNRIYCPDQRRTPPVDSDNIADHIQFSNGLFAANQNKIISPESGIPFSGFFILTHKKAWEDVGGFTDGFLGVDNDYWNKLVAAGYETHIMPGLYCYHVYNKKQLFDAKDKNFIPYEKPINKKETLSVCMIMRNEEKNLHRCLSSVAPIADEIIIVDTGSSDRSIEIAESYGAKIHHHPWENNFALHRNQSIKYANGDWLLFIDADEELLGKKEELKQWLANVPNEFSAIAVNMQDIQNNMVVMNFNPTKIFRRGEIQYKNIVHNQPVYNGANAFCDVVFYKHYGYDLKGEDRIKKYERSIALLNKRLEENKEDYEAYFYLSQLHGYVGRWVQVLECCEKYIFHKDEVEKFDTAVYFSAIRTALVELNKPDKAKKYLDEAIKVIPDDLDIAFVMAEYGINQQDKNYAIQGAIKYLNLYHQMNRQSQKFGFHFTHTYNPAAFCFVCYHLGIAQLNQAVSTLNTMRGQIESTPEVFRKNTEKSLDEDLKKIGLCFIKNKGKARNSPSLSSEEKRMERNKRKKLAQAQA